jgi:hypothetical protein
MLVSIMGTYDNGTIHLDELPQGVNHAKVIVTLIQSGELDDVVQAMLLSGASFNEWDNDVDAAYDSL